METVPAILLPASQNAHPTNWAGSLAWGTWHPRRRRESATPPDTWLSAKFPTVWFWHQLSPLQERDLNGTGPAARIAWLIPPSIITSRPSDSHLGLAWLVLCVLLLSAPSFISLAFTASSSQGIAFAGMESCGPTALLISTLIYVARKDRLLTANPPFS